MRYLMTLCLAFMLASSQASVMLQPIDGPPIAFESLQGQWVFINYWATWCDSCLEEISAFNQFYKRYKSKNVRVFAVNYDALPIKRQQALIKQFKINYPVLITDPATALQLGDIQTIPVTFVFSPNGRLVNRLNGPKTYKELVDIISNNH